MHLLQIRNLRETVGVPERDKDHAVVGKGAERRDGCRFLTSTGATGRDKHACILACEPT